MTLTPIGQLRVQLITAIAVIMLSIWGAIAYELVSDRAADLRTAAQNGKNLSSIVAEHFSSYAGGADLLLQRLGGGAQIGCAVAHELIGDGAPNRQHDH